jgi:hypothetical protein
VEGAAHGSLDVADERSDAAELLQLDAALGLGVADQRLQHGKLYEFDPAGAGNALTETVVQVQRAALQGGHA